MSSLEIKILEFWCRTDARAKWQRDASLERPLCDANWDGNFELDLPQPVFLRIHKSERKDEWRQMLEERDFPAMVKLLSEFGCKRPAQVANMLDQDHRNTLFWRERTSLTEARLGKGR